MTAETNDDYCTCMGCGAYVPRESMVERVAEQGPYQDIDVSDIEGVREAGVCMVCARWRCPECMSAPTEKVIIQ